MAICSSLLGGSNMARLWRDFEGEPFLINPGGELAIFRPLDTEALIGGAGSALLVHYATVPLAQMVGVQERFGLKFRGVQALTGIGSGFLAGYFKLVPRSWVGAWVAGSVAMVTLDLLRDWNAGLLKLSYYDYRGGDMARSVRGMRGFRGVIPESVGDKYNESG